MNSAMPWCCLAWVREFSDHRRRGHVGEADQTAVAGYADRGSAFPPTAESSVSLSSVAPSDSASTTGSSVDGAAPVAEPVFYVMRTIDRDRSGPTDVARISSVERRLPSRSSYSLV